MAAPVAGNSEVFFDAIVGQAEAVPQSAAQVAATGDYGDIPLVVLSANSASPPQMKEHESWRTCLHSGRGSSSSVSNHFTGSQPSGSISNASVSR